MTASQQSAKGIETGRKRLMTYGKTPRKRTYGNLQPGDAIPQATEPSDGPAPASGKAPTVPIPTKPESAGAFASSPTRSHHGSSTSTPIDAVKSGKDGMTMKRKRPIPSSSDPEPPTIDNAKLPHGSLSKSHKAFRDELAPPRLKKELVPEDEADQTSPKRVAYHSSAMVMATNNETQLPSGDKRKQPQPTPRQRRPRLIDALAAQRASSPALESNQDDEATSPSRNNYTQQQLPQRSLADRDARSRPNHRPRETPKKGKIKYTYSQSRSILTEPESRGPHASEEDPYLATLLLSDPPEQKSTAFDFTDDIDDETTSNVAIQSVHELRRAGAHNRFADEMEDLLYRIGTPNCEALTMRRNALSELAHKLKREDFASQFRDHAARDSIAKGIGEEKDPICGIALAAVLVVFLSSGPAPNLFRQLAEHRIGKLLNRLLRVEDDIDLVVSQKKMNLPRASRLSLVNVKAILVKMQIWHGYDLSGLSPQIMALQLLDIFFRVSDAHYLGQVAEDLEPALSLLAERHAQQGSEDDVGYALTVSILEAESSAITLVGEKTNGILRRSPTVARFLQRTLQRWPAQGGDLESNILKLAINTTNIDGGAAAFNKGLILSDLTGCISKGFASVQDAIGERRPQGPVYDGLLLMLGVMINILEHCVPARALVGETSTKSLVTLYLKHQSSITEADSVEKTQLSVAFGYLAIVLGYLSLEGSALVHIETQTQGEGILNLVETIQQFVELHKNVESRVHELERLTSELRRQHRA